MQRFVDYPLKDIRNAMTIKRAGIFIYESSDHFVLANRIAQGRICVMFGGTNAKGDLGSLIEQTEYLAIDRVDLCPRILNRRLCHIRKSQDNISELMYRN